MTPGLIQICRGAMPPGSTNCRPVKSADDPRRAGRAVTAKECEFPGNPRR
jgi:hypothetical protein